jgi:valyl-tRNA synthetase
MATYKLVWDDFCAWYLEMIKPSYHHPANAAPYQDPIDGATYKATVTFFENILKVLHPFMPFLTEELWHDEIFGERTEKDCCIVAQLPNIGEINTQLLGEMEIIKIVLTQVRNVRKKNDISPKEALELSYKSNSGINYLQYAAIIAKLGNICEFASVTDKVSGAVNFIASTDEFFIPLSQNLDPVVECARLAKEKDYLLGFLKSVNAKLGNERFMANAKPEIIEIELRKKADAEAKLNIIEQNMIDLAC